MSSISVFRAGLPSALATSLSLLGQAVSEDAAAVPRRLLETAAPIAATTLPDGTSGGVWANGADYKVSFHDGFVFYPYVGKDLPHQPLRWRTVSARLGGAELVGKPAAPSWSGFRCEYDLGGIVERYDVAARGVEQVFVIARGGVGDLVIQGEVITQLQMKERVEQQGALSLALADGRPVIEYGAAVAIDAEGREFPVLTSCGGTVITLRLPAAAVAQATFPLLVDPWITNTLGFGATIVDSDVLHEALTPAASGANTWVAYSLAVAANDNDVFVRRLPSDFVGPVVDAFRANTLWDESHPRLALAPAASKVVVVYSSGPNGPFPARDVFLHEHLVTDLVLRTSAIAPFSLPNAHDWRPAVGGNVINGNTVLVVFQSENGPTFSNTATSTIKWGAYNAAISTSTSAFSLNPRPNRDQERPDINQCASGNEWLVAFQEHDGAVANDDWDIDIVAVELTGILGTVRNIGVALAQAGAATQHTVGPRLAGSGGRYCLLYATQQFQLPQPKPQNTRGESLWVQRIDYDHANHIGSLPHPAVELRSAPMPVLQPGDIAHDDRSRSHWCATGKSAQTGNHVIWKLGYRGRVVESFTVTPPGGVALEPGGATFNRGGREFLLVYGNNDGSAAGNSLIGAVMSYDPVPAPRTFGFACGSGSIGGLAAMTARQQIGAEGLRFFLDNAPVDGVAFALLSLWGANLPLGGFGLPGCDLLVDPDPARYLGIVVAPVVGGRGSFALDLIETLAPFRLAVQWFYPAPGANPAGLLASNGLDLTVGR